MILNPDFKEFVALLNAHEVRFLVVGGYAVAFHGHPRYTKDLDVWVEPENARRLMRALEAFGFGSVGLEAQDFLEPDYIVQLGYPPNRIDLITSLKGAEQAGRRSRSGPGRSKAVGVDVREPSTTASLAIAP